MGPLQRLLLLVGIEREGPKKGPLQLLLLMLGREQGLCVWLPTSPTLMACML